jgi:hypothetical protein
MSADSQQAFHQMVVHRFFYPQTTALPVIQLSWILIIMQKVTTVQDGVWEVKLQASDSCESCLQRTTVLNMSWVKASSSAAAA